MHAWGWFELSQHGGWRNAIHTDWMQVITGSGKSILEHNITPFRTCVFSSIFRSLYDFIFHDTSFFFSIQIVTFWKVWICLYASPITCQRPIHRGQWSVCWRKYLLSFQQGLFELMFNGIFRDHSRDNALNFHKIRDVCILVMVLCMNLTLKGIVKICSRLITKRHWLPMFEGEKKSPVIFVQTDNQPTVGTNVTGNHNIRQHD